MARAIDDGPNAAVEGPDGDRAAAEPKPTTGAVGSKPEAAGRGGKAALVAVGAGALLVAAGAFALLGGGGDDGEAESPSAEGPSQNELSEDSEDSGEAVGANEPDRANPPRDPVASSAPVVEESPTTTADTGVGEVDSNGPTTSVNIADISLTASYAPIPVEGGSYRMSVTLANRGAAIFPLDEAEFSLIGDAVTVLATETTFSDTAPVEPGTQQRGSVTFDIPPGTTGSFILEVETPSGEMVQLPL